MTPDFPFKESIEENFPYIRKFLTLGEVQTPVIRAGTAYLKLDYFQPTFSYKDRGTRTLISYLSQIRKEYGIKTLTEDSSGNAGASIAAYGKAAGFGVEVYVPSTTSGHKLAQIKSYGANIHRVQGSREEVALAAQNGSGFYSSHVYAPEFRDGIRSLAYEIYQQFGDNIPGRIYVPTSAGTLLTGLAEGLLHLKHSGRLNRLPRLVIAQPEVIAPFCRDLKGISREIGQQKSIADALVTVNSPLKELILKRFGEMLDCRAVSETEILDAHGELASKGVLAELSSAVAYAAWKQAGEEVESLIILTGNGLKTL